LGGATSILRGAALPSKKKRSNVGMRCNLDIWDPRLLSRLTIVTTSQLWTWFNNKPAIRSVLRDCYLGDLLEIGQHPQDLKVQ
jgi:hypothetical protein